MKNYLSLVLFLLICSISQAQKIYITDTSNRWTIMFSHNWGNGTDYKSGPQYFKDTTEKNGHTYLNLYYGKDIIALIREDTANSKVFAVIVNQLYLNHTADTNEFILYDYSLQVGDTFRIESVDTIDTKVYVVKKISPIIINGVSHNYFEMDPLSYNTHGLSIIEGVGSTCELLFPYLGTYFEFGRSLVCFKNNGVYHTDLPLPSTGLNSNKDCNDSFLAVETIVVLTAPEVYPQPAYDKVMIKLPEIINRGNICMTNQIGGIVYQRKIEFKNEFEIVNNEFYSGLYYFRVLNYDNGKSYMGKIIFKK